MCYVITVEFEIDPQKVADFLPRVRENARASLKREPGCRQFDVCVDPSQPSFVFLYERYLSRSAFEEHLASEHFDRFDAATRDMVVSKRVRVLHRFEPTA
jgi:autoinducer 2-degrading protein